ncbi:MAG TPA: SRPBCC domain-containing protein [Thermoanaerobaculia bacterium]|nr:SRPBCC domain-containing protein [Thermoanaerobaculia bacterium]
MLDQKDLSTSRRELIVGAAVAIGGIVLCPSDAWAATDDIFRTSESIHQEQLFNASPKRVYQALTHAKQFHEIEKISGAVRAGQVLGSQPTEISGQAGGTFAIFGGHIVGRHIELVPNKRIVQAWRVANWDPGVYSIAKFELLEHDKGTKLVFDHTGFPVGQAQHLADGWKANYWEPLQKISA